ncbi:winged helix DNA-binding domain-containing protein [Pluteus cervinus]|uniref:Winged helix DNA-binding domain-containing protein n=1 Tax=Pluteus cervinus TaxID=181527 RepID=A0ACD3APL1_9AGAR|nr:winged helix DNA-binding domain-containing protein [Pluteus cervinus]
MGPRDDNFARSRRGGSYGGFDRGGFGRRGRGGYSRGFGRGVRGGYQTPQHQRQPFNVTPPPHYQPLVVGDIPNPNGYYPPPPSHQALPGYPIPHGYDGFGVAPPPAIPAPPAAQNASAAPFPAPRTALVFPLDPLRWFLLGQLEYYLSSQNLAADFFLRQRMDSRGWITISLLASFNRIKQLTVDMQLIRDVLGLSTEVEVKGDWVRTKDWAQYILPDAAKSTIEPEGSGIDDSSSSAGAEGDDDDDDEEEDVVFVMGDG